MDGMNNPNESVCRGKYAHHLIVSPLPSLGYTALPEHLSNMFALLPELVQGKV
jgi:hypothetical protein